MKLRDILQRKGDSAVTVSAGASVAEGIRAMYDNNVGSVLITSDRNASGSSAHLAGIFTERDVFHLCATGKGGQLEQLPLASHMTTSVVVCSPDDDIDDALGLMTQRRFRRIPIVDDGRILGVLSIGDLVKAKLEETVDEANALRQYIVS